MEKSHQHHTELHFLPIPPPPPPPEPSTSRRRRPPPKSPRPPPSFLHHHHQQPSLDLQLSISLSPFKPPKDPPLGRRVELLRWQAAEQRRLAAMEKAYAERVLELTRREMELAQSELARARILWDRTRDDVARVERMKENAMVSAPSNSNASMEITCRSCRRRFRPSN